MAKAPTIEVEIIRCPCKVHNGEGVEVPKGGGLAKGGPTMTHNLIATVRMGLYRTASGKLSGPWPIGTHGPADV
ncbi:hypothetical protein AB0F17_28635 [Nonomuraea sp. NPDC026600]|uniref:hypothetical protein n=1 Tax=Nonomuraea sp. NPDC026600 TaxID=3155363 RepID=UPI0033F4DDC4